MDRLLSKHSLPFFLSAFCMDGSSGVLLVVLPFLALDFGATSMHLGLLGAVRGGVYVLAALLASHLADRRSRIHLIAASGALVCVVLSAASFSTGLWHLFAATGLWAIALSAFWPAVFSWLGDSHHGRSLGRATGMVNLGWSTGGMLGGLAAGWMFNGIGNWTLALAALLPLMSVLIMMHAPRQFARAVPREMKERAPHGSKRALIGVWLGNIAACAMIGLMSGVFPKLGLTIGVGAPLFGVLMFVLGAVRSVMFALGLRWGAPLSHWGLSAAVQAVAAGMVATIAWTTQSAWCHGVFAVLGLAGGATYYRSLYVSLEGAGSRGAKSGAHEASLLLGILLGTLGGGALAQGYGERAPYVPIAVFVLALVAAQVGLILWVRAGRQRTTSPAAQAAG